MSSQCRVRENVKTVFSVMKNGATLQKKCDRFLGPETGTICELSFVFFNTARFRRTAFGTPKNVGQGLIIVLRRWSCRVRQKKADDSTREQSAYRSASRRRCGITVF